MITWITENVAIGEYLDTLNRELLKKEKIECVLSVREFSSEKEEEMCNFLDIDYYHVQVGAHQEPDPIKIELRTAAYMLELLSQKYKRILVHCAAGIDRAPFVVAYWLASTTCLMQEWKDLGCKKCIGEYYRVVKKKRPQIIEHYEWI